MKYQNIIKHIEKNRGGECDNNLMRVVGYDYIHNESLVSLSRNEIDELLHSLEWSEDEGMELDKELNSSLQESLKNIMIDEINKEKKGIKNE